MTIITCPNTYTDPSVVFVAGGISGCADWQLEMMQLLDSDRIVLLNPRREAFDITNPTYSRNQIAWEYKHLKLPDLVLFWFPCETLCPITLFELGVVTQRNIAMVVGCHPDYARRFDVIEQLSLYRPEVEVQDSIEAVANKVKQWCANRHA